MMKANTLFDDAPTNPFTGICKKSSGSTVGPTQKVPHSAVLLRPQ